ncbi:unnamed protein product (macronuclear) [Paramecium tetraurelia]|uniref:PH domain-containing protein n=1 Tax=Paramecium tetraurelia TaxID=5888 RepID=A0EC69_PARTE|nr:uncharacterized protein GSPATT00025622001 [Paramecium tetraurelia]CAK92886.1 unnamed protein product [Paramecium tetraurelia]|eukprot:XP_001460283.1 hypothetical protein (macronuclear) [Paramecium tetraurelia strain d4-2]
MNWLQQQKDEHESIFNNGEHFWLPTKMQENQLNLIFLGKAFQKQVKSRKWGVVHLELYVGKLVKNCKYLKEIKYSESSFQPYKHGFRLHQGKHRAEFFTESQDYYEKWQSALKDIVFQPNLTKNTNLFANIIKPALSSLYIQSGTKF